MTKEEDDLYADLYNDDLGPTGDASGGADGVNDSIYDEEANPKGKLDQGSLNATSSSGRSSFIPAAKPVQPSGSSFIPSDSSRIVGGGAPSSGSSAGRSFIPSTMTTPASASAPAPMANTSRIETAPMTNSDMGSKASNSYTSIGGDQGYKQVLPHEMPDEGKLFVGGLNWETTDDGLQHYFSQFGKVNYCLIMRDPSTQRSRGFAFLTFEDPKAVNSVMVKEHYLDGKIIDPKRAIPRQENIKTAKCFIGGIPASATPESFKTFFEQFGNVLDSTLMMDRETQKPRGYGFITYDNDTTVERMLLMDAIIMDGKMVEVKRATPRNADGTKKVMSSRTDETTSRGGNDSTSSGMSMMDPSMFMQQGSGSVGNPMAAMAAMMGSGTSNAMYGGGGNQQQSSFDPQMMAQLFQQQNWGNANFNPMAFQQMMMGGMGMGGMGGMGMGMGGLGLGGWGGGNSMSPWMNNAAMNMGSMSPVGGAVASPNPSVGATAASSASYGATGMMKNARSQDLNDSSSMQSSRGRNLQAPSSAGLPSRPSIQDEKSSNSSSNSRDYSREKSPDRGNNSSKGGGGGGGSYNRDGRW